jgi:hypothetical protein
MLYLLSSAFTSATLRVFFIQRPDNVGKMNRTMVINLQKRVIIRYRK